MKRKLIGKLKEWKERPNRKPLILLGARQVGKTWLMREFGRSMKGYVDQGWMENIPLYYISEYWS